jgi:tape measure domain-containing protein
MASERLDIVVTQRGAKQVAADIEQIGGAANRTASATSMLTRALQGLGAALIVRGIASLADSVQNMQNKLMLTSKSTEAMNKTFNELYQISQRTRTEMDSTVTIFSRMRLSIDEAKVSTQELLQVTESMQQAVALSGASTQEATNAMIQLAQGMASGVLRGDELRSVLEQLPYIADVIAKSLGVTRGELRQMGTDGKITTDIIIKAFQAARAEINDKFLGTIVTIGQGFVVLQNGFMMMLNQLNQSTGIFTMIGQLLATIGLNMNALIVPITAVATLITTVLVGVALNSLISAFVTLTAVIMANPLAFLLLGLTTIIIQVILFRDSLRSATNEFGVWGNLIANIYDVSVRVFEGLKPLIMGFISLIQTVIELFTGWKTGADEVAKSVEKTGTVSEEVGKKHMTLIETFIDGAQRTYTAMTQAWEKIKAALTATIEYLKNLFKGWIDAVMGWINSLIQKLMQALMMMKALGGGGGGGGRGGGGGAGGFNMGGNVGLKQMAGGGTMVGGNPGIDNNLLSINGRPIAQVSASERISVKPGRGGGGGGGGGQRPVVVNFNIQTPDADSFNRSAAQLQARAAASMARAAARNG